MFVFFFLKTGTGVSDCLTTPGSFFPFFVVGWVPVVAVRKVG